MVSSVTTDAHISLANAVIGTWISLDDFSDRPFLLVCRFLGKKYNGHGGRVVRGVRGRTFTMDEICAIRVASKSCVRFFLHPAGESQVCI